MTSLPTTSERRVVHLLPGQIRYLLALMTRDESPARPSRHMTLEARLRAALEHGSDQDACPIRGGKGATPGFWLGTVKTYPTCPTCHGKGYQ